MKPNYTNAADAEAFRRDAFERTNDPDIAKLAPHAPFVTVTDKETGISIRMVREWDPKKNRDIFDLGYCKSIALLRSEVVAQFARCMDDQFYTGRPSGKAAAILDSCASVAMSQIFMSGCSFCDLLGVPYSVNEVNVMAHTALMNSNVPNEFCYVVKGATIRA